MGVSKSQIIAEVADQSGASAREVRSIVDAFLGQLTAHLNTGNAVSLGGFGTFDVEDAPVVGKANRLRIKASKVPKFNPGKALRDAIG